MWYDNQRHIKCCIPFCANKNGMSWDTALHVDAEIDVIFPFVIFNRLVTFFEASLYYTSQIESQYMAANFSITGQSCTCLTSHVLKIPTWNLHCVITIVCNSRQLCAIPDLTWLTHAHLFAAGANWGSDHHYIHLTLAARHNNYLLLVTSQMWNARWIEYTAP